MFILKWYAQNGSWVCVRTCWTEVTSSVWINDVFVYFSISIDAQFALEFESDIKTDGEGCKTNCYLGVCDELCYTMGQRGRKLLMIGGYTYARNNQTEKKTYWACRTRVNNQRCNARAVTALMPDGSYHVTLTNPVHSHCKKYINE